MSRLASKPHALTKSQARRIWLRAQRLDHRAPFGDGPEATRAAVEHLGYVQIDTIHVIERCHHHILYTRIPEYRREHLRQAQSVDKSRFRILDACAVLRADPGHAVLHPRHEAIPAIAKKLGQLSEEAGATQGPAPHPEAGRPYHSRYRR